MRCPFCRHLSPESPAKSFKMLKERAAGMKCPGATRQLAILYHERREFQAAFNYYSRAATLGDVEGHRMLGEMYMNGEGVERSMSKALSHSKIAAIGGHPLARFHLGVFEWNDKQYERGVRHWIIAAHQGENRSLKQLKEAFKHGLVRKDNFAAALRGHQAAVDATKSPQREEAAEYVRTDEGYVRQHAQYMNSMGV